MQSNQQYTASAAYNVQGTHTHTHTHMHIALSAIFQVTWVRQLGFSATL